MNQKIRIFFLITCFIFLVFLFSFNLVLAFGGDSFSQQVGEEYVWEVKAEGYTTNPQIDSLGDQLKIEISITNTSSSPCCGVGGDALYGHMYNNSVANRTWERFMTNFYLAVYNQSAGFFHEMAKFFFPHNETVLNLYFENVFTFKWDFQTYNWTSGPTGYDGLARGYNGSSIGDLGQPMREYKIDTTGALEFYRVYNGTGSSWNMIYSLELIDFQAAPKNIPGFTWIEVIFLSTCIFIIYTALSIQKTRENFLKNK